MSKIISRVKIVEESLRDILRAYYTSVATNARLPLRPDTQEFKDQLARQAEQIFARDLADNDDLARLSVKEAIAAADVESTQIGLLSGSLVLQEALRLMQYQFPVLRALYTDFDSTPGLLNQEEITRIVLKPAVQTYDNTLDNGGRPKGWVMASPAQTVDVPIKLDEHVGVPIVFGVQTLASTMRRLFEETAPMALYALGDYFVKKVAALFTAANFNAYSANTVGGGSTTSGSNVIGATSTANMFPGQEISGTGIPANTYVKKIKDSTNAEITQNATATGTGLTFTLNGGKVPIDYATYISALADFNMASLSEIGAAFDTREIPEMDRAILLSAQYYGRLGQDPSFNSFFAAVRQPEVITKGTLPELQGFNPLKAPWFPTSSNRVGFAFQKAGVVLKTRLPVDFANALGAMVPGSLSTVTAPSGLTVALVQYVNLQSSYAEWRPEIIIGAGVGDRRAGLVITSA